MRLQRAGAVDTARLLALKKNRETPKKTTIRRAVSTSARLIDAYATARLTVFLITLCSLAPEDPTQWHVPVPLQIPTLEDHQVISQT